VSRFLFDSIVFRFSTTRLHRISPYPSPTPEADSKNVTKPSTPEAAPVQKVAPPEPELELELQSEPPSVEETLAARRARRQAILAKYASEKQFEPEHVANGNGTQLPSTNDVGPPLSSEAAQDTMAEATTIGKPSRLIYLLLTNHFSQRKTGLNLLPPFLLASL
jgi:hypothetical protein